jgi:hypothetical protein
VRGKSLFATLSNLSFHDCIVAALDVFDARKACPNATLAQLYDSNTMLRTWLRRTQNLTVPLACFREVNGKYEPFPRVSRFGDYKERNGMMIPTEVEW